MCKQYYAHVYTHFYKKATQSHHLQGQINNTLSFKYESPSVIFQVSHCNAVIYVKNNMNGIYFIFNF